ncbi:MAG: cation diffusion facilitator family transporter [Christensenellales bacterium]
MSFLSGRVTGTILHKDKDAADPAERNAAGRRTSLVGLLCNGLLALFKFLVALLSGSVSIMADAVNNLSDAASSVISLIGFKMAAKPADLEHPYGHARYEYLAGLTVAVLIMIIGVELLKSSLDKVLHPSPVLFSWLSVGVLAAAILVKLWMAAFYRKVGRRIDSQTLIASAADSRNDVITTAAVLVAALASHFLKLELDGYIGLAVAAYILYSGYGLVRDTLDPLLGKAPDPRLVQEIREKIMGYPGVLGTHDLLVHDYGPGRRFGSVHVEMAAENSILESHDVIDNIERDFLRERQLHLIVHLDPIVTRDPAVKDLRLWLSGEVKAIDPGLSVHDLRLVKGPTHTNVIFDCVKPAGFHLSDARLREVLSDILKGKDPKYYAVVTLDDSYAALPSEPAGPSQDIEE